MFFILTTSTFYVIVYITYHENIFKTNLFLFSQTN